MLRKQKETVGRPGSHYGVRVETIANTAKAIQALAEAKDTVFPAGSNERLGSLSFASMKTTEGLQYDIHNDFTGLDENTQFDVVERNFIAMAKVRSRNTLAILLSFFPMYPLTVCFVRSHVKAEVGGKRSDETASSASDGASTKERCFLEESNTVVKHHLVFKWTSVHEDINISTTIGSLNLTELKPSMLSNTLNSILIELDNYNLAVCVVVGDGAGENATFFDGTTTETISKYISEELSALCHHVSLDDLMTVMLHPVADEPIFIIEDMPHVIKRLTNALERSSKPKAKRDLRWNGEPINLSMIRAVWEARGGKSRSTVVTDPS